MKKPVVILSLLFLISVVSCSKQVIDHVSEFIGFRKPDHFPEPVYSFEHNPVTAEGFELGRRLFYEPMLSRNNTISCGSCHIQYAGFTHHGHDVSHGIDDRLGRRNAPPVMNLAWHTSFNWDGGVFDLDLQPIVPITTHEEMDESMDNILRKLSGHPEYPDLFRKAFNSEGITSARLFKALSQFMLMCISSEAKYDRVMRGEEDFTVEEREGYVVFRNNCNTCHQEPLFTDLSFRNNGIGIGHNGDEGRYEITLDPEDKYKFKVPSLRNLSYTAPYMHDGRYYTLDAVLTHYTRMRSVENIDPIFEKSDGQYGLVLTEGDRKHLVAFLKTLNDESFIRNKMLSE